LHRAKFFGSFLALSPADSYVPQRVTTRDIAKRKARPLNRAFIIMDEGQPVTLTLHPFGVNEFV
jgi:hypothetical protein